MRGVVSSTVFLVILTASVSGQGNGPCMTGKCGRSVEGIVLCLSRSEQPDDAILEVRNTGTEDAVLRLGEIVVARQYPTAITLALTDAKGKQHNAEVGEPTGVISGRILPFVVPLPRGASLKLPLRISKSIWYASGQLEDFEPDPKKRYSLRAQFTGKGVSQAEAGGPDFAGIALTRYWTGAVISNTVAIGPN